jgi:hypothetical protein
MWFTPVGVLLVVLSFWYSWLRGFSFAVAWLIFSASHLTLAHIGWESAVRFYERFVTPDYAFVFHLTQKIAPLLVSVYLLETLSPTDVTMAASFFVLWYLSIRHDMHEWYPSWVSIETYDRIIALSVASLIFVFQQIK